MSILTNEQLTRISNLRLLKEQGNITEVESIELDFLENMGQSVRPTSLSKIYTSDKQTKKLSDKEINSIKKEITEGYKTNIEIYKHRGFDAFIEAIVALEIKKHTCGLINDDFSLDFLKEFGTEFSLENVLMKLIDSAVESPKSIVDIIQDSNLKYPKTHVGHAVKCMYFDAISTLTEETGSTNLGIDYVSLCYILDHACVAMIPGLLRKMRETIITYKPELKEILPNEPTRNEVHLLGGMLVKIRKINSDIFKGRMEHTVIVVQDDLLELHTKLLEDRLEILAKKVFAKFLEK